jgi:hypothetical protein
VQILFHSNWGKSLNGLGFNPLGRDLSILWCIVVHKLQSCSTLFLHVHKLHVYSLDGNWCYIVFFPHLLLVFFFCFCFQLCCTRTFTSWTSMLPPTHYWHNILWPTFHTIEIALVNFEMFCKTCLPLIWIKITWKVPMTHLWKNEKKNTSCHHHPFHFHH